MPLVKSRQRNHHIIIIQTKTSSIKGGTLAHLRHPVPYPFNNALYGPCIYKPILRTLLEVLAGNLCSTWKKAAVASSGFQASVLTPLTHSLRAATEVTVTYHIPFVQ